MSFYPVYRLITSVLFQAFRPFLGKLARPLGEPEAVFRQRLGIYPDHLRAAEKSRPCIWFHAASVGEVSAALGIVETIAETHPGYRLVFSTMSAHGQQVAKEKLGSIAACCYAPLDFTVPVKRALSFFRPEILVCLETEIWPNWLAVAQRSGVKTVMVNGRISVRSIRSYRRIRPLIQPILANMTAFSMIRTEDADRIIQLGAIPDRVAVNGNAKYDRLEAPVNQDAHSKFSEVLALGGAEPVFVAGSTRSGEEEMVLDAYRYLFTRFPDSILVIAPRHIERSEQVKQLVAARGFDCQLRTEIDAAERPRRAPVVIVNTIGELTSVYGVATVVFCGGSLVPLGGHNILEAAVWGKPVVYGPHMDDFRDAKTMLEQAGGGLTVADARDLGETVARLLADSGRAAAMGAAGQAAVMANQGAARRHAKVIQRLLDN